MAKPEGFFETITVIEFRAYDKDTLANGDKMDKHFVDATPKQCADHIKKNICATAVITRCVEYKIIDAVVHNIKEL